jgi:hypothetical protein
MDTLVKTLSMQVTESDSALFGVKDQMERNLQYYTLEPLGNEQRGRSHYVSPDVHDYVESKKALFSQTFLANRQVVKFSSSDGTDEGLQKTAYVNAVLNRNDKEQMFHDLWHDAFLTKRCTLLVEWVDDTEEDVINIPQPITQEMLMAQFANDPTVRDVDTSQAAITMMPTVGPDGLPREVLTLSGPVTVIRDAGDFSFTVCQPERFYRDPVASSLKEAMWATYMDQVPRGTLINLGYSVESIMGVKGDRKYGADNVEFSRTSHDGSYVSKYKTNRTDDQELVDMYKTWTWINLSEIGAEYGDFADETRLYEIHWADNEILMWADGSYAIREVEKGQYPFFEWSELRISHSANGMCGADVVAHSQKVNSVLKRAIIDNQNIRNNSRFEAVYDNLLNPRDLIDNTTGGVIFSEQIGSVAPLATPELSPLTMNVLQVMKEDTEARSGLSSLTKGMNTAVITQQNATDMIERLTNAAGSRPSADARSFAQTFLIPLFKYIVSCAKIYDQSVFQTEMSGRAVTVAPQSWQGDFDRLDVAVALTPEEAEAHAQKLLTMHQMLSMDPVAGQLYGVAQRHSLLDEAFDAMGVSDTASFMMRPDSPEFAQMQEQQAMMEQQMQEMQMQLQQFQMQLQEQQIAQGWAAINNSMMDKMEDNARADRELAVDTRQGDRELDIKAAKSTGS